MSNQRGTRVGLTLGKYAPFHAGHQFVVETALAEMDEVIVVIYDAPEATPIPLSIRAGWIRQLYPQVRVVEAWDGPSDTGDTPAIKRLQEDYILRLLAGEVITHFYSSEFYGEHMSAALGAVNRQVDPSRAQFPVSGTAVREAPYEMRHLVHPLVYQDFIAKVVFLGAPSTGKSTIAEQLANRYQSVWMPEYGREYWEQHQQERRLSPQQLVEIAEGHLQREEQLLAEARKWLFVDTNAITTYMFAHEYHGMAEPQLSRLADRAAARYELVFLCEDDIPYDDTWDRSGEANRAVFQKRIKADLQQRKIPYFLLTGSLEARMERVARVLSCYRHYHPITEIGTHD